jgi:hypothetical protein
VEVSRRIVLEISDRAFQPLGVEFVPGKSPGHATIRELPPGSEPPGMNPGSPRGQTNRDNPHDLSKPGGTGQVCHFGLRVMKIPTPS